MLRTLRSAAPRPGPGPTTHRCHHKKHPHQLHSRRDPTRSRLRRGGTMGFRRTTGQHALDRRMLLRRRLNHLDMLTSDSDPPTRSNRPGKRCLRRTCLPGVNLWFVSVPLYHPMNPPKSHYPFPRRGTPAPNTNSATPKHLNSKTAQSVLFDFTPLAAPVPETTSPGTAAQDPLFFHADFAERIHPPSPQESSQGEKAPNLGLADLEFQAG
jgi:hypothetical protein